MVGTEEESNYALIHVGLPSPVIELSNARSITLVYLILFSLRISFWTAYCRIVVASVSPALWFVPGSTLLFEYGLLSYEYILLVCYWNIFAHHALVAAPDSVGYLLIFGLLDCRLVVLSTLTEYSLLEHIDTCNLSALRVVRSTSIPTLVEVIWEALVSR